MSTHEEFLAVLDAELDAAASPTRRVRGGPARLSFEQETLWFLECLAPGLPTYNMRYCYRLRGRLDTAALHRALVAVTARHEGMRTYLSEERGEPVQIVATDVAARLPVVEVDDYAGAVRRAEDLTGQPLELGRPPLWRAELLRLGPEDHLFVFVIHHIVADAWSVGVFLGDLDAFYRAECAGAVADLDPMPITYADYAEWQREHLTSQTRDELTDYWRAELDGAPVVDVPTDRARPSVQTFDGTHAGHVLNGQIADRVARLSAREGVRPYAVYLAAFFALLRRYTGQDDLILGSPTMNRDYPEVEPLVGFFINMLPVRVDAAGDPSFREFLDRVWDRFLDAFSHSELPFGQIVDAVRPVRDPARSPLFQIAFSFQNAAAAPQRLGDVDMNEIYLQTDTARFDMSWNLAELPDGVKLLVEFNTNLFDRASIEQMITHFERILSAGLADPGQPLSRLGMLADDERRTLLESFQGERRVVPDATIDTWFERHVTDTPDAVALVVDGRTLTYADLDARANRVAHALRARGAGPERVVGVHLHRDEELVIAILAVLKSGAAFLPLDPGHPPARLAEVVGDADPVAIVTTGELAALLPAAVPVLRVDADADAIMAQPARRPPSTAPDRLAYVLYTSGSTGRPKGVLIEHRSVVNFIRSAQELFQLTARDHVLGFTAITYDVCVFEMFAALLTGATLFLATDEERLSIDGLQALLERAGITVIDLPPSVMALLEPERFEALRIAFVGGEAFAGDLVNRWNRTGRRFFNGYGPTECTVTMIVEECSGHWETSPPIGLPMANHIAYVLDDTGSPVPYGVVGELVIGGEGLARGYLNRADITAEKFGEDPFALAPGGRVYRTGDLVRRLRDGRLVFVGRRDRQVKIRGLRIEPGEIEAVLGEHAAVASAAVEPWTDERGERHLVAYVTTRAGAAAPTGMLRAHLAERLPASILPSYIVELTELPLTTSGKVDRARLPAPDRSADTGDSTSPRTDTERILVEHVFTPVLGLAGIGIHDDFFALGGNSLQAAQLVAKARRRFEVDVKLIAFLRAPTVARLAELVDAARGGR